MALAATGLIFSISHSANSAEPVVNQTKLTAKERAAKREEVETIEVTGVRGALESALNTKREAISIVDAISAADIDALPALDLGEALQAIPGIQVNRDEERRQSSINLRGLPGGYTKITANGQSFATPSRSNQDVGDANPFGSFESGVFDGVTVYKSPTAAMQEGGVAGNVDKRLQRALAKKDGQIKINLGGRYEELQGSWNKQFSVSVSKHLIKDKLAVAFKLAGSEQNFRRDTLHFNNYDVLNELQTGKDKSDQQLFKATDQYTSLEEFKLAAGIASDAVINIPRDLRQVVELSGGDRISFTGNIQLKVTDNLKISTDLLYTKRDLDDNKWEQFNFSAPLNNAGVTIAPRSNDLFYWGKNDAGKDVYGLSAVEITNVNWSVGNRVFNMYEEAKGIFIDAEYMTDEWKLSGAVSKSESENIFNQTGVDVRYQGNKNPKSFSPTGVNVHLHTGEGNLDDFFAKLFYDGSDTYGVTPELSDRTFLYPNPAYSSQSVNADRSKQDDGSQNKKDTRFYVFGGTDSPKRNLESINVDATRFIDLALFRDNLTFETFSFGVRQATEEYKNIFYNPSVAGIDLSAIKDDLFTQDTITTRETPFFDGLLPNVFNAAEGWWSMDTDHVIAQLQNGMDDRLAALRLEEAEKLAADPNYIVAPYDINPENGFVINRNKTTRALSRFGSNFENVQDVFAAYVMTDFSGEVGSIPFTGNLGGRYVKTENVITGTNAVTDENGTRVEPIEFIKDYSNFLPSMNMTLELSDDVLLRTAAYRGMVRPNLRKMSPASTYTENDTKIRIDLPQATLEAYTADSLDLSIEWYNREGSAISLGLFQKTISGLIQNRKICPTGGGVFASEVGELRIETLENDDFKCYQVEDHVYTNDQGEVITMEREVDVKDYYNSADTIKVKGLEIATQQKLDFLPYPWNGFGGILNYSYVETTSSGVDELKGISPNTFNAIGYWENDGISLRLAYNYRDRYKLQGGSSIAGLNDKNVVERGQLDFSASYTLNNNVKFNLRGFNLTNEKRIEFDGDNERAVRKINYDGRTYSASVSFSF